MHRAAFVCNKPHLIHRVYSDAARQRVADLTQLEAEVLTEEQLSQRPDVSKQLQVIFSTWGMPQVSKRDLPELQAVFYAAGSVKAFAPQLLEEGVVVVSAREANGTPVAEFCLAQILLANKGYFQNVRNLQANRNWGDAYRGEGNYGATVAILGMGSIGRQLVELLAPHHLRVIAYDPHLTEAQANSMGVAKVSLEQAFAQGDVVSNNIPLLPETRGMLGEAHFSALPSNAVFINTARGAIVDEPALVRVLQQRRDLTALLDVTDPEPPAPDSALHDLSNVVVSTHIAGSIGQEVLRMADLAVAEYEAFIQGKPLKHAVTSEEIKRMA